MVACKTWDEPKPKMTITTDGYAETIKATVIASRRRHAAEMMKQAEAARGTEKYIWLRFEAFIAKWEADTLEREGKLPDEYMELLRELHPHG